MDWLDPGKTGIITLAEHGQGVHCVQHQETRKDYGGPGTSLAFGEQAKRFYHTYVQLLDRTFHVPIHVGVIPAYGTLGLGLFQNKECTEACKVALQNGYRMIDSACLYKNEKQVGDGVRQSGVNRNNVFITSKVWMADFGTRKTTAAVADSIKKIGFDYYDLYLVHSAHGGKELRLATYKALLDAKAAGLIRYVGVSNHSGRHIEEMRQAGLEMPVVNQIEDAVRFAAPPVLPTEGDPYTPLVRGAMDDPVITKVAKKYNKDAAQILIRWSMQKGWAHHLRRSSVEFSDIELLIRFVPLPKSSQPSRIISNGQVYNFNIEPEDMAKLDALDKGSKGGVTWNPIDVP
ncbi:NADP-dependent oxidoreductase domain-containing protein [Melanogaster broomeanus]|nr:NADP-dependent oxidoreductase domain-containing protein [Melanogaster broomeanus]